MLNSPGCGAQDQSGENSTGCYSCAVNSPEQGHREVEHTADLELEVWAPDMPALIEEAARGMYGLMGVVVSAARILVRRRGAAAGVVSRGAALHRRV